MSAKVRRLQIQASRPPVGRETNLARPYPTAILHTIFFHRYFTPITPLTRDLLDLTLPAIDDVDLETQIDQRAAALVRDIDSADALGGGGSASRGRGQLAVLFYEKRRRKAFFFGKNEEEICWERWILDVTVGTPRTETGTCRFGSSNADADGGQTVCRRGISLTSGA